MKRKKKISSRRKNYRHFFQLALFWVAAVFIFIIAVFSYGTNIASGLLFANNSAPVNSEKSGQAVETVSVVPPKSNLDLIREKVEAYIVNNIVSLAGVNGAEAAGLEVEGVNFINDNRALIFYGGGENNDRYLAEVVFQVEVDPVKIERFILKIKNDMDYSGGVYGAD
jgi:hypothetical protein